MIDKTALTDCNLSLKAKGLYTYFMCLPDDWKIHVGELTQHFPDGKAAIYSALKELEGAGYVLYSQKKVNGRYTSGEYIIYEQKCGKQANFPQPDFPDTENQDTENQDTENRTILNNNKLNNNNTNNNNTNNAFALFFLSTLPENLKEKSNIEKWNECF